MRTLFLGGNSIGRELSHELSARGWFLTGMVPADTPNNLYPVARDVIPGGVGSPADLARWVRQERIELIIDCSGPFDEDLSLDAAEVAALSGIGLIVVEPPTLHEIGSRSTVHHVADAASAAAHCRRAYPHVFVDLGTADGLLRPFGDDPHNLYVINIPGRLDRHVARILPPRHRIVSLPAGETPTPHMLRDHQIDGIVVIDDGFPRTAATIEVADASGVESVLIKRPARPWRGRGAYALAHTVEDALGAIYRYSSSR